MPYLKYIFQQFLIAVSWFINFYCEFNHRYNNPELFLSHFLYSDILLSFHLNSNIPHKFFVHQLENYKSNLLKKTFS